MSTRINHNILSITAQRNLWVTQGTLDSAINRLSSGLRINYSWDDPAGLAVSERMRAQITSMTEAERNANYNVNLLATAEGGVGCNRREIDPYEGVGGSSLQRSVD